MDGSGTADRVDRAAVSPGVSLAGASHTREVDPLIVTQRLQREGRWAGQIELERDDMMPLAKDRFATKEERQLWVYSERDRMYPPLAPKHANGVFGVSGDGQIQGRGEIPDGWPELPPNAPLGQDVAWVQANRLRIVEERRGRPTLVRLDRALSPAPSWAALGWLETSIRSYAKFVDVAARAASTDDGEASWVNREKMALEELEALLNEMLREGACPTCGRPI